MKRGGLWYVLKSVSKITCALNVGTSNVIYVHGPFWMWFDIEGSTSVLSKSSFRYHSHLSCILKLYKQTFICSKFRSSTDINFSFSGNRKPWNSVFVLILEFLEYESVFLQYKHFVQLDQTLCVISIGLCHELLLWSLDYFSYFSGKSS